MGYFSLIFSICSTLVIFTAKVGLVQLRSLWTISNFTVKQFLTKMLAFQAFSTWLNMANSNLCDEWLTLETLALQFFAVLIFPLSTCLIANINELAVDWHELVINSGVSQFLVRVTKFKNCVLKLGHGCALKNLVMTKELLSPKDS